MLLLVPSDPLRPSRYDPHFAPEAAAALEAGIEVSVVDHDALQGATDARGVRASVRRVPHHDDVVYRGWMVTASRYELLAQALAERGALLRTSPAQYRRGHELPGWYQALASFTPHSCWTSGPDLIAFSRCLLALGSGPAVLRDYTKSLKHRWVEAALIAEVTDEEASRQVASRFIELRGDQFDGGLVLRRFEELVGPEVRTWWVDGRWALSSAHPDTTHAQPDVPPSVLRELAPAIQSLALPFVTADLVRRADGHWRVVEIGDGQVSDRPSSCPPETLIRVLSPARA